MILAKQGLRPPQGFFFEEIDKSIHKGKSWGEVERKVIGYRKRNGFPIGNVMVEIMEQANAKWPTFFWQKRIRGE